MNNVIFDNYKLLYLIIPLSLLVIIPYFILLKKKSFKWFNLVSLFSSLMICSLLSMSIAGIKTVNIKTESTIYIVADVSNTTKNVIDEMDDYIKEFKEKLSPSSKLGVVCFASDSQEIVKPGEELVSLKNVPIDDSSTNFQKALNYTASLFEDGYKKRIVLLSDGKETDGDVLSIKDQLISQGIRLDAVYFDSSIREDEKEIVLKEINASNSSFLNSEDEMTLIIQSNYDAAINVDVYDNDSLFYFANHIVKKGINEINISCNTNSVGTHSYQVVIDEKNDVVKENNTLYFVQQIHEKCEVLIISSSHDEASYIASTISNNANTTIIRTYDSNISTDINKYVKYDEIILSNADLNAISNNEGLVNVLETLVTRFGKSVITFGGKSTYLDGGFANSKLYEMLPVDINPSHTKKKIALMLVIDNSGSMSGERLHMAKVGAKSCLDILTNEDYFGVITFESNTRVVQPLTSVYFKERINNRIDSIQEGDGTMMTPGLLEAFEEMKAIKGQINNRQVILISDGMPGDSGQQEVVREMAEDGIIVSTIAIGASGSSLLSGLADLGNGNYYRITGASSLPNVMLGEVNDSILDTIIEKESAVDIKMPHDPIAKEMTSLSTINGYNYSKAKYNSTTILATTYEDDENQIKEEVPIYSYWDYGKGKVSSFMSDLSSNWTNNYFKSDEGKTVLNTIIKENLPSSHHDSCFFVNVVNNGLTSSIEVDVLNKASKAEVRLSIITPSGNKIQKEMTLTNGVYYQQVETIEKGVYDLHIEYINKNNSSVMKYDDKFTYSYSIEYDLFTPSDNIILYQLVEDSGLVSSLVDEIVNIEQEDVIITTYYSLYLLVIALTILLIEIAIRKIRLKDIKNLFKKAVR